MYFFSRQGTSANQRIPIELLSTIGGYAADEVCPFLIWPMISEPKVDHRGSFYEMSETTIRQGQFEFVLVLE